MTVILLAAIVGMIVADCLARVVFGARSKQETRIREAVNPFNLSRWML